MSYNTKWEIYIYDVSKGTRTRITDDEKGRCQNPVFKPGDANNRLAYLCMAHYGLESDLLSLRVYTPATGRIEEERNDTPHMNNAFMWVMYIKI